MCLRTLSNYHVEIRATHIKVRLVLEGLLVKRIDLRLMPTLNYRLIVLICPVGDGMFSHWTGGVLSN